MNSMKVQRKLHGQQSQPGDVHFSVLMKNLVRFN